MKKTFTCLFLALAVALSSMSVAVAPPATAADDLDATALMADYTGGDLEMTVERCLSLTPKKVYEATGQKLSIKQAIGLKVAQKKMKKALKNQAPADDEGKSQIIALILAIVVGGLGVHRFYLGYTTIGIIQLLTLGGCGIWALIDIIRIATGDLGPEDGSPYGETL